MTEWRDISTAPAWKDEDDLLLLFQPHDMGGFIFVGGKNPATGLWFNNLDGVPQNPTHWMPLPEPPARLGTAFPGNETFDDEPGRARYGPTSKQTGPPKFCAGRQRTGQSVSFVS